MSEEKQVPGDKLKRIITKALLKGPKGVNGAADNVWCPTLVFHQPKRPIIARDQIHTEED